MTKAQILWAMSHDWYVTNDDKGVFVWDDWEGNKYFNNFQSLRDWAGY